MYFQVSERGRLPVPQLPPPGWGCRRAGDGSTCVGRTGVAGGRRGRWRVVRGLRFVGEQATCPRDRSSTHDLPACARHSPPLCMRDTRPQCTTRCALLVSLGGVGVACVLTAGALLLAACWCARRRHAASRFASCAEPAAAAQCVASGLMAAPRTPRRLGGLPPQAAPPASHLCVRELPHIPPHHRRAQHGPRRRRAYPSDAATIQAATHLPPLPPHQPPPPPPPPRRRACYSLRRRRARRRRRSRRRRQRCGP